MNFSSQQIILPPGWVLAGRFGSQSAVVSVAAGAGVLTTLPQQVTSKQIAPGSRIYLERISCRVVDQSAFDQLYFALRLNGSAIQPWDKISGEQTVDDKSVEVGDVFESGLLEVVATNISGTAESGAAQDAVTVRVIARFSGYLLRYTGGA